MSYDLASLVQDFADAFVGVAAFEQPLPFDSQIPRAELDYSLDSLQALDRYLELLHANADTIEMQQMKNVMLGAGCYLGEVIRRHAAIRYRWVNYDDYFPNHPELATIIPRGVGTSVVLVRETDGMAMPLNKIHRFIGEGPVNSTHFYAIGVINGDRS